MPTLLTIPFSHFCEKARWALDHASVSFREEGHPPGLHRRAVRRARGAAGSVPVLLLDDGTILDDSPLIVRWADERAPAKRKLLPAEGRARDEALALERHLDFEFAPHVRRLVYFHLLPDRARTLALMRVGTPLLEYAVVRAAFPLLRRVMRSRMRIDESGALKSRDKVRITFDEIGRRLSDGRSFLLGDSFGVADLAFAAFAAPLLQPPEHPFHRRSASAPSAQAGSTGRASVASGANSTSSAAPIPGLADESLALRSTPAGAFALRVYRDRREGDATSSSAA